MSKLLKSCFIDKILANLFILAALLVGITTFSQTQSQSDLVRKVGENLYRLNDIEINTLKKTVTIPCSVNMTNGLIEVVLCRPEGKTHESLLATSVTPLEFQTSLLLLGLDPVNEIPDNPSNRDTLSPYLTIETSGDLVEISLEIIREGKIVKKPIESFIRDERTKKAVAMSKWLFRGAVTHYTGNVILDLSTSLIATFHDPLALMEINGADKFDDELFYVNETVGLVEKEEVMLIIKALK